MPDASDFKLNRVYFKKRIGTTTLVLWGGTLSCTSDAKLVPFGLISILTSAALLPRLTMAYEYTDFIEVSWPGTGSQSSCVMIFLYSCSVKSVAGRTLRGRGQGGFGRRHFFLRRLQGGAGTQCFLQAEVKTESRLAIYAFRDKPMSPLSMADRVIYSPSQHMGHGEVHGLPVNVTPSNISFHKSLQSSCSGI